MSFFASGYHIRFKCADGIQFEFDYFSSSDIRAVRSWCGLFRDFALPSVFKPCSFDVSCKIVTSNDDLGPDFTIAAFRALSLSLRYPYLFNSKFYRYALKNKEKRSSEA